MCVCAILLHDTELYIYNIITRYRTIQHRNNTKPLYLLVLLGHSGLCSSIIYVM